MENWLSQDAPMYVARLLSLLLAVPLHEVSHAFVSYKLGDPTAKMAGRLTLNPIKHFDPLGLLSMLLIGIGWAKPVPIDPRYYKNRKVGTALSAAAGPLSNLVLAFLFTIIYKVVYYAFLLRTIGAGAAALPFWMSFINEVLFYYVFINISLALFNLLPIPPLDGSRIIALLLPQRVNSFIARYERYSMILMMAILFIVPRLTGFSPLSWLLGDASSAVLRFMYFITGWVEVLFGL